MNKNKTIISILIFILVTLLLINQSVIQQLKESKERIVELEQDNNRIVQYMVELEKENQILGSCCANDGNLSE
jgi:predicted PurR-regulated permease PerM|tara:strand:- start:759 stop:977 length:219 start_codon:yes stop_codon:yes gene_type:complete